MCPIEPAFDKLLGLPCWNVKRGYGSFLTMEFGSQHLEIRAPVETNTSPRVKRWLSRRQVTVRGDWHLWIYCCDWRLFVQGKLIGDSTNARRIDRAAQELNGQKFQEIRIGARGARTMFAFDLGAVLETKPFDRQSEQWHLYEPDGHVLTWRADRTHEYGKANYFRASDLKA